MKTYTTFKPVKSWGIKPPGWGVVCLVTDQWWLLHNLSRKEAIKMAHHLQDAYQLGRQQEAEEARARGQALMDKLGI